jgi:hypothetical protein
MYPAIDAATIATITDEYFAALPLANIQGRTGNIAPPKKVISEMSPI